MYLCPMDMYVLVLVEPHTASFESSLREREGKVVVRTVQARRNEESW